MHTRGKSHAICLTSLRYFSEGERSPRGKAAKCLDIQTVLVSELQAVRDRTQVPAMLGLPQDAVIQPDRRTSQASYFKSANGNIQFKEIHFIAGERNVNINMYSPSPHEVYENTYSTPEYIQWLFAQSK